MHKRKFLVALVLVTSALTSIIVYQRWGYESRRQQAANEETGYVAPPGGSGDARGNESGNGKSSWAEVLIVAENLLASMRSEVQDYQGVLLARERVAGKLSEESRMQIKVRNPSEEHGLSAYLKFESAASKGREVIWSEDHPGGMLVAHEEGLKRILGTLELDPNGMLAMAGQKYPITDIGLIRLAEKLIEKGEKESQNPQAQVRIIENQMVGDRVCRMYQVTNPHKSDESGFHIAQVCIDVERNLPLRFASYLWPEEPGQAPPLEEEYTYLHLELNPGLTDLDFDRKNPKYNFPLPK
ncbi:MAG: DUF1571 domain-containing protein [Planctomycetota bacterium]|nr:DUF1571 domain-containing protein [Planctomycetota bacterium]